jgi:hypothetical protein
MLNCNLLVSQSKIMCKTFRHQLQKISWAILAQLLFTQIGSVLAEDYISPELVKITTPQYRPESASFSPRLGVYEYSVGWEGINAASCSVTIDRRGDTYVIDAAARTYSGVDLLYKLRYEAIGTISANDLSSIKLSIDHQENSRHKNIEVDFKPQNDDVSHRSIHAVRSKGVVDPDKKILSFSTDNFTLDPIAAVFLARSLAWNIGDTRHFDVFNGKSRYLISLTAKERSTIRYKGETRPVIVITPQVRNLTTTKPRSKLRQAYIYVSDDPYREVLRIESSVFIGRVITELDSYTPLKKDQSPAIQLVQSNDDDTHSARAQMR